MSKQAPDALRLAVIAESMRLDPVAAELRRLHAENQDYRDTFDGMIASSCDDQAEIVLLENRVAELMEIVKMAAEINPFGDVRNAKVRDAARAVVERVGEVDKAPVQSDAVPVPRDLVASIAQILDEAATYARKRQNPVLCSDCTQLRQALLDAIARPKRPHGAGSGE